MKLIATHVEDSTAKMKEMVGVALQRPGFGIDPYFYRSHLVYEKELNELVFCSWLYACHISEIPEPGDYQLLQIGEDSVIISRDAEGEVHALMNICRHRGARVCEESSGHRKTLVCPYHGWVYNMDGSLKAAREMEAMKGFDVKNYGLKKARIEIYMGLIFINCDPAAAEFRPALQELEEPLGAYDLENARVAHRQTYRVDANWKFVLENYLECYHCATSHRAYARMHTLKETNAKVEPIIQALHERAEEVTGIEGITKELDNTYMDAEGFGACVGSMRYGLYDGYVTGSQDGQPVAPLMGNIQGYDGGAGDFQLGPLTFMLNYPDHCVLFRFIPRRLTWTDMEVIWFVNGDAREGVDYDKEKLIWLWHNTTLEDEYIITRNSEGANSLFYEPGPYHPEFEADVQNFMRWYLDTLAQAQ